ncbi:MAG: hypothetical protein NVSMB9_08610 [Isosphaeraceae bacterium]
MLHALDVLATGKTDCTDRNETRQRPGLLDLRGETPREDEGLQDFQRLVALYQINNHLLSELDSVGRALIQARIYQDSAGSNPVLAAARTLHLKVKRSAVLSLLRANRVKSRPFLARRGNRPQPGFSGFPPCGRTAVPSTANANQL